MDDSTKTIIAIKYMIKHIKLHYDKEHQTNTGYLIINSQDGKMSIFAKVLTECRKLLWNLKASTLKDELDKLHYSDNYYIELWTKWWITNLKEQCNDNPVWKIKRS